MIRLLHRLVVVFLYVNVFGPTVSVGPVSLSKALFAAIAIFYGIWVIERGPKFSSMMIGYLYGCFAGMTSLVIVSVLLGNDAGTATSYAALGLFTLIIPVLWTLNSHYSIDFYVAHITRGITILATAYITLYLLCGPLGFRSLADFLENPRNPFSDSISFAFFPQGLRIGLNTAGFFPAGLVLVFSRLLNRATLGNVTQFCMVGLALYLSYTASLWGAGIISVGLTAFFLRPSAVGRTSRYYSAQITSGPAPYIRKTAAWQIRRLIVGALFFGGICYFAVGVPEFIIGSKLESVAFKHAQFKEAFSIFSDNPFWGAGLGHKYSRFDLPSIMGDETILVENSYATILASTGLLGAVIFAFIYGFWPFAYCLTGRQQSTATTVLFCHLAVLIQAVGNPYLWSGGLGLLFSCFVGAYLTASDRPATTRWSQAKGNPNKSCSPRQSLL